MVLLAALLSAWGSAPAAHAADPELLYSFTMDTDPGWSTQGQWAFGQPVGGGGAYGSPDPTSGYTGSFVYGYNLAGDYLNNMSQYWLTSQALDCSGYRDITVRFQRWLGVEDPSFDHAIFQASNDGVTWQTVWQNTSYIDDGAWVEVSYNIDVIADEQPTVYLRWGMGTTDGSVVYCGWNIDDVEIFGIDKALAPPTKRLAVFTDPTYVDTSGEVLNLIASLELQDVLITQFSATDDVSLANILSAADVLVVPELERASLASDLNDSTVAIISDAVANGLGMVICGEIGNNDEALLNRLFGFGLTSGTSNLSSTRTAEASGTAFEFGPSSLPANNGSYLWLSATMPPEGRSIYSSGSYTSVAHIPVGVGGVVFLAWDWFDAFPNGSQDGGWNAVLGLALEEVASLPPLMVSLPETAATEGDGILGTPGSVWISEVSTNDLVITLASANAAEVSVPGSVIIPAGQTNALFDVVVLNDAVVDGSQEILITAANPRFVEGTATITIHDDETAVLSPVLPYSTFEGIGTVSGTLSIDTVPAGDVLVQLVPGDLSQLEPGSVLIEQGQTVVQFTIGVVDDNLIEGIQTATLTAHVQNWTSTQTSMIIIDDEQKVLSVQLPADVAEGDGVLTNAAMVQASGTVATDLTVSLSSSDATELTLPAQVVIAAGESNALFDITVNDDAETDGVQQVGVTVQAAGFIAASDHLSVQDNDPYSLSITGLSSNVPLLEATNITVMARTVDGQPAGAFAGPVILSASGDRGAIPVFPETLSNVVNGATVEAVAFGGIGNDVVLTAEGGGLVVSSMYFNVVGPQIGITPADLADTLVVVGESDTRTLVISNTGNAELQFTFPGAQMEESGHLLFYEGFEDGNYDGWNEGSGSMPREVTAGTSAEGLYSFSITGSSLHYEGISHDLADIQPDRIDVHVRSSNPSPANGYFVVGTGNNETWNQMIFFYIYEGYLRVATQPTNIALAPCSPNQWYKMTFLIDWTAKQFDVLVDDELIITDINFRSATVESLSRVDLYNRQSATAWWDGIAFYSDTAPPPPDLNSGTVASYPFNGNANDESGNGHNGTVAGATLTTNRFGDADSAYSFDGVNDQILLDSDVMAVERTDAFSHSFWIRIPASNPSTLVVLSNMDPASNGEGIVAYVDAGRPSLWVQDISFGGMSVQATATVNDGQWHHLAIAYDGSSSANGVSMYIDGLLQTVSISEDSLTDSILSSAPATIGAINGLLYYTGEIDDVRIFDHSLTELEVQNLYNENDAAPSVPAPIGAAVNLDAGLVASYLFSGDASDGSGNGYDGTLVGASPIADRFGEAGSAFYFDGVNDRIDLPAAVLNYERTDTFSESFWVKSNASGTGNNVIAKMQLSGAVRGLNVTLNDGLMNIYLVNYQPINRILVRNSKSVLNDNQWHHVVVTYDGSSTAAGVAIYVDGERETTETVADNLTGSILNNETPTIGSRNSAKYYSGAIDDVRIYDRVLTADEVDALDTYDPTEPVWMTIEPLAGSVAPGDSMPITFTFDTAERVLGDYLNTNLIVLCNDALSPSNAVEVSMGVVPPAPAMAAEPIATPGTANVVFWYPVNGPVEYMAEVADTTNAAPLQQSGWLTVTNHTFTSLSTDTLYYYRARASVTTTNGLFAGPWSGWVESTQLSPTADTDTDAMPDYWELQHFGSLAVAGNGTDSDGDGQLDRDEYIAGMNPTDNTSYFAVYDVAATTNGQFVVYWDSVTGRIYTVNWTPTLTNAFGPVATDIHYPQNSYTDIVNQLDTNGFYQVEVEME